MYILTSTERNHLHIDIVLICIQFVFKSIGLLILIGRIIQGQNSAL